MSPPTCSSCSQILSGSFYTTGVEALCAACGKKRQDAAGTRRVMGFVMIGLGGVVVGLGLYGFIVPRWGLSSGGTAFILAVAASLVVAWFRRPAPVEGPRPVGNTMPPPDSGQV